MLHPFIGSVQQYSDEIADPDRYRPDHRPQCEAARPEALGNKTRRSPRRLCRALLSCLSAVPWLGYRPCLHERVSLIPR